MKPTIEELKTRIAAWIRTCFGTANLLSRHERAARVVEEAIELAQAEGLDIEIVKRIARRVYDRAIDEPEREAAGVGLTLLAWHFMNDSDPIEVMDREMRRVEAIDPAHFRAKHQAKVDAGTGAAMIPDQA